MLHTETHVLEREGVSERSLSIQVKRGGEGEGVEVRVSSDMEGQMALHWGVVGRGREGREWKVPALTNCPPSSTVFKNKAVQTPFQVRGIDLLLRMGGKIFVLWVVGISTGIEECLWTTKEFDRVSYPFFLNLLTDWMTCIERT